MNITFHIKYVTGVPKFYAVNVENMQQAQDVLSDVYSLEGYNYIRLNKCGRLHNKSRYYIMNYNDYFSFNWYGK